MSEQSTSLSQLLAGQLIQAHRNDQQAYENHTKGARLEIPVTGTLLSNAYEQLRNSAEYAEEHLLLQRAIKRFCKLNLFLTKQRADLLGQDLVVDLVQAGYLQNGRIGTETASKLNHIIKNYMEAYGRLRQAHVNCETAMEWMLAFISVEAESLLNPHSYQRVSVHLAYQHFLRVIDKNRIMGSTDNKDYEACMYIAVHQALLKSDIDIVRHDLFIINKLSTDDISGFRAFNEQIDQLFTNKLTLRLKRIVSRYGAPFRVLKSMIDDRPDISTLLQDKQAFMDAYRTQIHNEFKQVKHRLARGLYKSIVFIIITKLIIGIAIEVPYDILVYGSVALVPLAVNLLFPPLYMASLKFGLHPPPPSHAQPLHRYMETVLYGDGNLRISTTEKKSESPSVQLLYALLFSVPVVLCIFILQKIGFNFVQMIIFFMFFSTASFLGFRLSTIVRELELTSRQTGLLVSLRDFFYFPFILSGQWLSRKYGKLNLVAHFLDIAIEMPLKAILRLVRQWIRFLNDKRDELY